MASGISMSEIEVLEDHPLRRVVVRVDDDGARVERFGAGRHLVCGPRGDA